jgi:hypothetical protein
MTRFCPYLQLFLNIYIVALHVALLVLYTEQDTRTQQLLPQHGYHPLVLEF